MRLIDAEPLEELLRSRCAQYSNDYGSIAGAISGCLKLVQAQETITPPTNPPLTLEELREMDGEPVYIVDFKCPDNSGWEICNLLLTDEWNNCDNVAAYGKTWLAYRRKPEEET